MAIIGYHASHEQFTPSSLLQWAQMAEAAGFGAVHSSDHFNPWSERQGQSGFSFAWLGAAMQATSLPFGMVCTPGYRNHPALVAQAIATYGELFPGRFWISLGSGQALNESITGEKWPIKKERDERLKECITLIRKLLAGETVTHYGRVNVEQARLYTLPKQIPLLMGAAITEETARLMGGWADGMITIHKPYAELKKMVTAFREGGGEGKPIYLKVQLSYAHTYEAALQGAYDQWRNNIFPSSVLGDLTTVAQFDALGEFVQPDELKNMVRISEDLDQHAAWIEEDISLGFEKIILHNVNREQELFIKDFGRAVLPRFK